MCGRFNCVATSHVTTVQKSDFDNDVFIHLIKLWIANCKHFIRGANCTLDIQKMGRKSIGTETEKMTNEKILEEVLHRLERNIPDKLIKYILNCRKVWENYDAENRN